ncbi:MAG: hypothetical protein WCJ58_01380 [bacterium]
MNDVLTVPTADTNKPQVKLINKNIKKWQIPVIIGVVLIMVILSGLIGMLIQKEIDLDDGKQADITPNIVTPTLQEVIPTNTYAPALNITEPPQTTNNKTTGTFSVKFSYPSDFVPPRRICFDSIDSRENFYCFHTEGGSINGTLPVGKYFAYVIYYSIENNQSVQEVVSLNECTISGNSDSAFHCPKYTAEYQKRKEQCTCDTCNLISDGELNVTLGGERKIYQIINNKNTDLGLINDIGLLQ